MFRFLSCLLLTSIFMFVVVSNAAAEYRFKDGTKIEVQWYEKKGLILNEHVCFNYKTDKIKLQQCRHQAKNYFKEECEFYTDKIKKTQKKYRDMYTGEQEKFCKASETYKP